MTQNGTRTFREASDPGLTWGLMTAWEPRLEALEARAMACQNDTAAQKRLAWFGRPGKQDGIVQEFERLVGSTSGRSPSDVLGSSDAHEIGMRHLGAMANPNWS